MVHMRGEVVQRWFVLRTQRPHAEHRTVTQSLDGFESFGIGCNGQPRRTGASRRLDAQPGIEGDGTRSVREQWIDVDLTDLRVIGGELAEANQHFDDSLDVRSRLSAISL